ncbi:MAG: cob(I)yrinic acid a,c-diamide adenosyltransferase [Bdellovibrionia bacterium]
MSSVKETRGLIVIHTGDGKGKTTAALGIVFRALGRGIKCGVIQFLKGKWETGEKMFAKALPQLDFYVMGLGFTWDSDDLDKDKAAATAAWAKAVEMINGGTHKVVVLDEIMYAFHYGWVPVNDVIQVLQARPKDVHVILTGRRCPESLQEAADLVSSAENVKHPYKAGIPAQIGIDF